GHGERVHHAGQRRALLAELEEHLAHAVVGVVGGGHVPFGPGHGEPGHGGGPLPGQPPADRPVRVRRGRRGGLGGGGGRGLGGLLPGVRQGLADLAVVAVDGQRLQAELPALDVGLLDVLDGGVLRHVDRLADRAGQVRLDRRHHPDVAHRADRALTHGAVEHLVVFGSQAGGVDYVAVLGDVLGDRLDLFVRVAEVLQRPRHGLVDDLHGAAADQLLELDQGQVGLDAGGVAVHHQPDGPGRREQAGLRVPVAVRLARLDALLPGRAGQVEDLALDRAGRADLLTGVGVLADDPLVRLGVARVAVVGADGRGQLGRGPIGGPGHQRGDRGGDGPAAVGIVGVPGGHQQRAQVGVADAQLAVGAGGLGDLLGREVGEADRDVHRGDDQLRDFREPRGVEGVVVAQELEQVDAGQVATGVVQVDVLTARVAGADPARLGTGVPVVDGAVVLDAGVGAVPGGLGHAAHQLARVDPLDYLAGAPGQQVELLAFLDRAHELVGDPDRVVGVLVLDADNVLAAQVHVEPGVAEHPHLLFLARLGRDEVGDVRVVHVEH